MASQTQNVANAIFQQFFPIFLNNCNFYTFYFFAGINFMLGAFVWFFIPETKNIMLEEMDTLFGGNNHVEKGGDILAVEDVRHASVGDAAHEVNTNDLISRTGAATGGETRRAEADGEEIRVKA